MKATTTGYKIDKNIQRDIILRHIDTVITSATPLAMLASPLFALFIAWGISTKDNFPGLTLWVFSILLSSFFWQILTALYKRKGVGNHFNFFRNLVIIASTITGTLWGLAVIFFLDVGSEHNLLFLAVMIFSVNIIHFIIHLTQPIFIFTFLIPSFGLLSIGFYIAEENPNYVLISIFLVVLVLVGIFTIIISNKHNLSIALLIENENLIAQLKEKETIATLANNAKTLFLAHASHDLRQPLHAQQMLLSILDEKTNNSENKILIQQLQSANLSLANILSSLLDISKLDAQPFTPNKLPIKLNNLFKKLQNEYTLLAQNKPLKLKIIPTTLQVKTDENLLYSLLSNLVSNALKYTPKGWVILAAVKSNKYPNTVCIDIRDSGIGIPISEQENIFNEFYQINNPERNTQKGIGLGLSIVKRITTILSIPFFIDTNRKKGTRFSLYLPIATSTTQKNLLPSKNKPFNTFIKNKKKRTILIIDDNELIVNSTMELMKLWGNKAFTASSKKDALTVLAKNNITPDIILSDYQLEGNANGIETLNYIQKYLHKRIPSIIITGDTSPESIKKLNQSGYKVLYKPIDMNKLNTYIQDLSKD